jgi:hypothetical protein
MTFKLTAENKEVSELILADLKRINDALLHHEEICRAKGEEEELNLWGKTRKKIIPFLGDKTNG